MNSLTSRKRWAITLMVIAVIIAGVVVGGFSLVQKLTYVPPTSGQTRSPDQIELPDVTVNNYDHVRALAIYREFARFYGCAQPLDLQNLSTSMLVPNINTVAVITYVREQRKYVVAESNPKINLIIKESGEQDPTFIITAVNNSLGCGAKPDLAKYGFTLEQVSKYNLLGPEAY